MTYYSSWEPKLKGMGERLMERIVLGLLQSSGMTLPDLLRSISILRKFEKESPEGSNQLAPGKLVLWLFFPMSKMAGASERS